MNRGINRRMFLKRTSQAGGLVVAGSGIEALLAACGGNVAAPTTTAATPGATKVASSGLKVPGVLQWGSDFVDGAPYVFKDPKNPSALVGFEVEIAAALARVMGGIRAKQVETDYGHLEQALGTNQFDFVMNGWEITEDRTKNELYSDPYYRYGQQIVVRADDTRFSSLTATSDVALKDLEGLTVGTGTGYKAADDLATDKKINTKLYDGNLPFDDVKQKKIDAMMVDLPIVAYYVLGSGPGGVPDTKLKPIGKPLFPDVYVVGFNKSNPNATIVLKEINQALAVLKKDGTLKQIYQRWSMWNDQQAAIGIV
ncbi:MAG: amino acid ABC transporter substrate-binding protein [Ktedonobacteraceae bacterium]|nr:amino acid ABC transporter substrate-binding protein [Ktedonobacteraceae bacterium]